MTAIQDVSLEFRQDQFISIIGPNGAGKTTFFNLITGNLNPTSGRIWYRDEDITEESPHQIVEHGIARSFQTSNLFAELTVRENIRIGVQRSREWYNFWRSPTSFSETIEQVDEIIDLIQLRDHSDKLAGELAHADQRLLEVGITLSVDPQIILLDEPTAGMSGDETTQIMNILTERVFPNVQSIIMIEHDMDVVMAHSDRTVVLHNGAVLVDSQPQEIEQNQEVQRVYLGET